MQQKSRSSGFNFTCNRSLCFMDWKIWQQHKAESERGL